MQDQFNLTDRETVNYPMPDPNLKLEPRQKFYSFCDPNPM